MRATFARFTERASAITPGSPFHPLSHVVYGVFAVGVLILTAYFLISDFRLGSSPVYPAITGLALALLSGLAARRYSMPKIAILIECVLLLPLAGAVTVTATVILARHSMPFVDPQLLAADAALGFDWRQLFALYQRYPGLMRTLDLVYTTLMPQLLLMPLALYFGAGERRLWWFLTAWVVAYCITLMIFPFAPAAGPMNHFAIGPGAVPELHSTWQWQFAPLIAGLRSGEIRELSQVLMGIVQFPSFHAAGAVMLVWASLQLRWLGAPLVMLNLVMLFTTLINGDHYLIDVLAGTVIGLVSIWLAGLLIVWQAKRAEQHHGANISPAT